MKYLIHTLYLFTVFISIIDFIRFTLTSADLCRFLHFSALISAKMPVFSELCKQAVDIFTGCSPSPLSPLSSCHLVKVDWRNQWGFPLFIRFYVVWTRIHVACLIQTYCTSSKMAGPIEGLRSFLLPLSMFSPLILIQRKFPCRKCPVSLQCWQYF